jgi:Ni/Co efflux regulator RcnB
MNRLKIFLIGAALATGGSALASAQAVRQDVAYHDRDRDRDHDRDRDRDRDRRYFDRDHDRDDRRYFDRDRDRRYDYGYVRGDRRWNGHRWLYWNGYEWVY